MSWNESNVSSLVHVVATDSPLQDQIERILMKRGVDVRSHRGVEMFLDFESEEVRESCLVLGVSKSDHRLPGFYEQLKALAGRIPTVLISDDREIRSAVECLKAGATDYLVRPYGPEDVMAAVEAALAIDHARRSKAIAAAKALESFEMLTSREKAVMGLVTTGLLNKQVAWSLGISEGTIKCHRAHVMSKMNVKTLPSLVRLADLIALQPDGRLSSETERSQVSL